MTNISKVTKVSRKDQILQALARMLETSPVSESPPPLLPKKWVYPKRRCIGTSQARRACLKADKFIEDTLFQRISEF